MRQRSPREHKGAVEPTAMSERPVKTGARGKLSNGNDGARLHVIAGRFKGLRLQSPHSSLTHPMGSREKIALFNMLLPYLTGAKVLDIYAGTGALGIEALSRGASEVIFVEKSPQIARILQQNLAEIGGKGHLEAISGASWSESRGTAGQKNDAASAIVEVFMENARNFAQNTAFRGVFSVILADPPYDGFDVLEVAELPKLLQSGGILALSFPYNQGIPEIASMSLITVRKYAAAGIALYQKD